MIEIKILDATAGFRGIWYQKNHPFVTFMDIRNGKFYNAHPEVKFKTRRVTKVNPDVVSDWKDAPFPDEYFDMIIFDPPHLISKRDTKISTMQVRYGRLFEDTWRKEIMQGVDKLFKILKPEGIFILKWCENSVKVDEVIKLIPYQPLFGTRTGQSNKNHWILFIKHRLEQELKIN